MRSTYHVLGMSCGHCVQSVTAGLTALPGVRDVEVDLATAQVTVRSEGALATADVQRAIDDAGFDLAGVVS
ncbi:heavy-metal-associated domain-containing protein [Micromonospora andamanensis]|uniref:Metal-binding protein n=1 Tax=Micromonospora andamanensis TaxID=1287068 RepID=A0ABQ4I4L5_9ACTN|nr:cation transporter [Micromonospora andamanensis]GIJ12838.1 metal-binding protein [Micromonospora andamanensis]